VIERAWTKLLESNAITQQSIGAYDIASVLTRVEGKKRQDYTPNDAAAVAALIDLATKPAVNWSLASHGGAHWVLYVSQLVNALMHFPPAEIREYAPSQGEAHGVLL